MTEVDVNEKRITAVEREVHAMSGQIHSLASSVSEMSAVQRAQGERFDRMADAFEQSRGPEWSTRDVIGVAATVCLTIAVTVGGLFYGIAGYVDMTQARGNEIIAELSVWKNDKDEFQREMHHEVGVREEEIKRVEQRLAEAERKLAHFDELDHVRDEQIVQLREKASAAEVSRRAIGDYVKELASRHDNDSRLNK